MSGTTNNLDTLSQTVKSSWHGFLDVFEPLRPELYRYCRHLTRSAWDAEDLSQDALMRAFVTLGTLYSELPNPRAWLFRVASNLWIDRMRRSRYEIASGIDPAAGSTSAADEEPMTEPDPRETREAAGSLLVRLSPQERAALVLKDVFEFSLEEVAELLQTSVGAVKTALHRARARLSEEQPANARVPVKGVLDAFCAAFNAGDLERLTALLLDSATVEIVGVVTEYGREAAKDPYTGSFANTLTPLTNDERGGVAHELLVGYLGRVPRCEVRAYRGSWILLLWYEHTDGPKVRTVMTAHTVGAGIAHLRNYFFTPHVIADICSELAVPYCVNGYRYWQDGQ